MGQQLMAIVAEANRKRVYLEPTEEHVSAANIDRPVSVPMGSLPPHSVSPNSNQTVRIYGFSDFADLFTNRQLVALTTFNSLVAEARSKIRADAWVAPGLGRLGRRSGNEAGAYADAVATYLAMGVSRLDDIANALCRWENTKTQVRNLFGRQNIPMVWDFAEAPPFGTAAGSYLVSLGSLAKVVDALPAARDGLVKQADASSRDYSNLVVSTDPPYYDNIGDSDLSDFFYVWESLSRSIPCCSLPSWYPRPRSWLPTPIERAARRPPRSSSLMASIESSITSGLGNDKDHQKLLTVYYAYKQQEANSEGASSTGWHTLLDGLIEAGWEITATWPMRTETSNRMVR